MQEICSDCCLCSICEIDDTYPFIGCDGFIPMNDDDDASVEDALIEEGRIRFRHDWFLYCEYNN